MNDTMILTLCALGIALILGLTLIRVWYTMWTCAKLNNNLNSVRMQIGQVRSVGKTKMGVKNDLGNMDINQLAEMFGIDKKIMENPIVQGFLEGVLSPKQQQEEPLNR